MAGLTNSGPSSERMNSGAPWILTSRDSTSRGQACEGEHATAQGHGQACGSHRLHGDRPNDLPE